MPLAQKMPVFAPTRLTMDPGRAKKSMAEWLGRPDISGSGVIDSRLPLKKSRSETV